MSDFAYQHFNPRKVQVFGPGEVSDLAKNSQRERELFRELADQGVPVPPTGGRFWTDADIDELVTVCTYVRDHLPASAFSLEGIPGLEIYLEEDCVGIGGGAGAYEAIRRGPTGLIGIATAGDRYGDESGSGSGYHRFSDAVKDIFFGWLCSVAGVLGKPVFDPELCTREVTVEDFTWSVHRHLFTPGEQAYQEAIARKILDENPRFKAANTMTEWIEHDDKLLTAKNNPDAWMKCPASPHYLGLSYGLGVDAVTFLDRVVVAIDAYKKKFVYPKAGPYLYWSEPGGVRHRVRNPDYTGPWPQAEEPG